MEDISHLILGKPKSASPVAPPVAPSAAPSAAPAPAPKGDVYRFQNLRPEQVNAAISEFERRGFDPALIRRVLNSEEEFNNYPLEKRQKFFSLGLGAEQETADPVQDMIMGKAPAKPSTAAAEPPRPSPVAAPIIEKDTRKVGKVKDSATAKDKPNPLLDELLGAGETYLTLGTGAIAGAVGMPYGIYKGLTSGQYSEGKAADIAGKEAEAFMKRNTYVPRTKAGQENLAVIGGAMEASKIPPIIPEAVALSSLGRAKPDAVAKPKVGADALAARIDPSLDTAPATTAKPRVSYAEFQAQLEAKRTGAPVLPPAQKVQTATMPAPSLMQPFPEVRYAPKGKVNLPEQNARKDILSRVGLENARQSSISGDGFLASNEFQTSKVDAPVGQLYRDTFAGERAALENFGQRIVDRTGGSLGLDEAALYSRGTAITKPFDDFKAVLQTQMKQAYDQAKQVASGQPAVNPSNMQKFLDTDSNFTVNDSFMALRRGIQSHLKENGLMDANGRVSPMTVDQAENLRKYVNSNWNNERSGIIGRLKDNIDNDVTMVAGEDVYKNARAVRTKIASLLDDPKGVAKIMDYDPQSPMNRAVPFEKIATTVERMDVDQQRHLIKLLKEMPPELRPQADAAIAEIRAQFANRILEEGSKNKGQWNASNVTNYLNRNNLKLNILMEDKELAQMVKDLHDAGHIVKYDPTYPGAAIQAHNLVRLGAVPLLSTIGTAVGGGVGGSMFGVGGAGLGATMGGMAGAKKGVQMQEKSALKRGQKQMVPLKDIGKGK
jgi:hypothetical protein